MPTQSSVVLATAGHDQTIKFWEATTGRCNSTLQYLDSHINKLEISPDKNILAVGGNPQIRLFDINTMSSQPIMNQDGHTNNITALGFQCDGKWIFSGSEDGTVKMWDVRTPGHKREYGSRAAVNTVVLHPNQNELISGDEKGNIRVFDLTANSCSCELVPEVDTAIRSVSVMWDGSLVVAGNNKGACFVWKLQKGSQSATNFEPLQKLQAHDTYLLKCLLSPEASNYRYLATTSADKTAKLWNISNGFSLDKTFTGHQKWVWDCAASVDGAYLVTASSDTTSRLWSTKTGKAIQQYNGHQKGLLCCALNDRN